MNQMDHDGVKKGVKKVSAAFGLTPLKRIESLLRQVAVDTVEMARRLRDTTDVSCPLYVAGLFPARIRSIWPETAVAEFGDMPRDDEPRTARLSAGQSSPRTSITCHPSPLAGPSPGFPNTGGGRVQGR